MGISNEEKVGSVIWMDEYSEEERVREKERTHEKDKADGKNCSVL